MGGDIHGLSFQRGESGETFLRENSHEIVSYSAAGIVAFRCIDIEHACTPAFRFETAIFHRGCKFRVAFRLVRYSEDIRIGTFFYSQSGENDIGSDGTVIREKWQNVPERRTVPPGQMPLRQDLSP